MKNTFKKKPTKLTRKEREHVALLCRLVRRTMLLRVEGLTGGHITRKLTDALRDVEYDVRSHWRLTR